MFAETKTLISLKLMLPRFTQCGGTMMLVAALTGNALGADANQLAADVGTRYFRCVMSYGSDYVGTSITAIEIADNAQGRCANELDAYEQAAYRMLLSISDTPGTRPMALERSRGMAEKQRLDTRGALIKLLQEVRSETNKNASVEPSEDSAAAHARGDYATALRILQPLAAKGDASAQYNLAFMYSKGQGVPQDYREAVKLYRQAAGQGFAPAQHSLGRMYDEGQGVPQDYGEAVKLYRQAALQGYAKGQYALGVSYDEGQGVARDYSEAVKWWRLAAAQGLVPAQYNLGLMYGKGQGVPQDYVRAHMWSNLAAMSGDANALKNRNFAATKMTGQQIAEAQKMARECQQRNFKGCD